MSVSSGAVNVEDLVEDLTDGAERVELPALHLVEQAAQLGIVAYRVLEMHLRPRGRDREHLAGEIAPATLVELLRLLEMGSMRSDLLPQLGHALAARRLGEHDRRPPVAVAIEREDRADLVPHRLRPGVIP